MEYTNKYRQITIMFLSYEPSHTLVDLSKELHDIGFSILIVNDGSSAQFDHIFEEAQQFATVIGYKKNEGKGYAIKYGISYLIASVKDCQYFITADADGQHLIKDIIRVADSLQEKNEIVLGVRTFDRPVPARSRFGNDMSKFTQTLITGKYLKDNQCGLRGFPMEDAQWLLGEFGNRYEYEMNVVSHICMHDMKFVSLPIQTVYESGNPTSHFRPMLDTYRIQGCIAMKGLASIFAFIVQCVLVGIFYYLVFAPIANIQIPMELSLFLSTGAAILFSSLINSIIFHPRRKLYQFFKALLLDVTEMIFVIGFMEIFFRVLGLNLYLALVISLFLSIYPTFFVVKIGNMLAWKKSK